MRLEKKGSMYKESQEEFPKDKKSKYIECKKNIE